MNGINTSGLTSMADSVCEEEGSNEKKLLRYMEKEITRGDVEMSGIGNDTLVGRASPHTIKKFELIEAYVASWAQILLQNPYCKGIVFIDCMCNSGVYQDEAGEIVYGTPIRVSRILRDVAGQYPKKKIYVYLNDIFLKKIDRLKKELPNESCNFKYSITSRDANERLKEIGPRLPQNKQFHYFLFYDPFEASIDWDALAPFFLSWGEVLINHMVNDPVRAVAQVKKLATKEKYEKTYLTDFETLLPYGTDREAYERRIAEIINSLTRANQRKCYVATFPFFNSQNSLQYDLIHYTSNAKGFELFKTTAWKTFGGRSSIKHTHGDEHQYVLGFDGTADVKVRVDEKCLCIMDITDYLQHCFKGRKDVPLNEIWGVLKQHPIFPASGYKREIKEDLKCRYGAVVSNSTISFEDRG